MSTPIRIADYSDYQEYQLSNRVTSGKIMHTVKKTPQWVKNWTKDLEKESNCCGGAVIGGDDSYGICSICHEHCIAVYKGEVL